ncbi:MAG TPA: T9SS type A sorting domain-containing protein [Bacteroidota bacterium]|nr:T9SS type A sorting domain-containing protein [Bacteroidota bacterium]
MSRKIFYSVDNGLNWDSSEINGINASIDAITGNGTALFAGVGNEGVLVSSDNGANWNQTALQNENILCFGVVGSNVYAGTNGDGIYLTTDNGANWNFDGSPEGGGGILSLATDGINLYAANGAYLYTDSGGTWVPLSPTLWGTRVVVSLGKYLFAGTWNNGVFVSSDRGSNWRSVNTGLPASSMISALAGGGPDLFAITNHGIWRRPLSEFAVYTIVATADSNGTISPAGAILVDSSKGQQFTISPSPGYGVDSLIVDGLKIDSTFSYTFSSVTANHTIRVTFKRIPVSPWTFTNTGMNHTIIIDTSVHPTLNAAPLDSGDFIGVFYDSSGTPACAGYSMWVGNRAITVAAFGNELPPPDKNGFEPGEIFQWKIFRWKESKEYAALASYYPPDSANHLITNTDTYATNGISSLSSLLGGAQSQSLSLRKGWSIISGYVNPQSSILDSLFGPINPDLIIVKNGSGKAYIPSVPVNTIGLWNDLEGYQLKMDTARTLAITGASIVPEVTPIALRSGWSIIPYLRQTEMSVDSALSSIGRTIIIVKDQDGHAYIPAIPVDGIGTMEPGQGYQVKLTGIDTLLYAINEFLFPKSFVELPARTRTSVTPHYERKLRTDNNATIVFPKKAISGILMKGDEVGVFDENGMLVGSGVYEGENFAVAVWGDDPTTQVRDGLNVGDEYVIRFWYGKSSTEHRAKNIQWTEGAGTYEVNGISVVGKVEVDMADMAIPDRVELYQNYPNPFNPATTIRFSIPKGMDVRIRIYNVLGEAVAEVVNGYFDTGYHEIPFTSSAYPSGVYYCRIEAGGSSDVKKMLLMK